MHVRSANKKNTHIQSIALEIIKHQIIRKYVFDSPYSDSYHRVWDNVNNDGKTKRRFMKPRNLTRVMLIEFPGKRPSVHWISFPHSNLSRSSSYVPGCVWRETNWNPAWYSSFDGRVWHGREKTNNFRFSFLSTNTKKKVNDLCEKKELQTHFIIFFS